MTRRVRQLRARADWTERHLSQLACGHAYFGGWGELYEKSDAEHAEVLEDMAACWLEHGEQILAEHRNPLTRPWGWWQFQSHEPRDATKPEWFHHRNFDGPECDDFAPEWYQLIQFGVLTDDFVREQTAADVRRHLENHSEHQGYRIFRRPLDWWLFHSPQPRNPAKCELSQLVEMRALLKREQKILDGDLEIARDWTARSGSRPATWQRHLQPAERKLIGLPPYESHPAAAAPAANGIE